MQFAKSFIDAFERRKHVEAVCGPVDTPPPIYDLNELVKITLQAASDAVNVADELASRAINTQSAVVKYKALWAIEHIAQNGSPAFRTQIQQRHMGQLRQLQHYQGPPDQFKGQAINNRVREHAVRMCSAVYSESERPHGYQSTSAGLFSDGLGAVTSDGAGASGGYAPPSNARGTPGAGVAFSGFSDGLGAVTSDSYGNATGGYASGGFRDTHTAAFTPGHDSAPQSNPRHAAARAHAPVELEFGAAATEASIEAQAVRALARPGGARVQPTREELRAFVAAVKGQSMDAAVQSLLAVVKGTQWEASARALSGIHALLSDPSTSPRARSALHPAAGDLRTAERSPQSTVSRKAAEVLLLLGGTPAASAAPTGAQSGSLVDVGGREGGDGATGGQGKEKPSGGSGSSAGALGDLLGDMGPQRAPAEVAGRAGGRDEGDRSVAAVSDLLGDMGVSEPTATGGLGPVAMGGERGPAGSGADIVGVAQGVGGVPAGVEDPFEVPGGGGWRGGGQSEGVGAGAGAGGGCGDLLGDMGGMACGGVATGSGGGVDRGGFVLGGLGMVPVTNPPPPQARGGGMPIGRGVRGPGMSGQGQGDAFDFVGEVLKTRKQG